MSNTKNLRNIAILAHADAGKTSLTEQMLYRVGQIKSIGSVDDGTTHTDFLAVEKERGISVRSAHTTFHWKDIQINLIDTPGHVDFSSDVERIMRVIDAAVLVISAVESVQAHTVSLWNALRERKIPVLIFVNKIDRTGSDTENVLKEINQELRINPLCLQKTAEEESAAVQIISLWDTSTISMTITEIVVAEDEQLMNQYLEGKPIAFETLDHRLAQMIQAGTIYPLLFGSAKYSLGITELLDAIVNYLPSPSGISEQPLSALVYGITHDKTLGKMAHLRIFNGGIGNREIIHNITKNCDEKVVQIRRMLGSKQQDINRIEAGDIAAVLGLSSASVGDILGHSNSWVPQNVSLQMPLITALVKANNDKDYSALAEAMLQLNQEDPLLGLEWIREEAELNVNIMGWIQMEVLEKILLDRFGIGAHFENPRVIYKETPAIAGEGFVRYWMPKPCWAILKFLIEPGEIGSGIEYKSQVGVNEIAQKYQNEVERSIPLSLKQGIKGWEVTDIRITLVEGEDHELHSRPGDFMVATPMGIMDGLQQCGTKFLEPIMRFRIQAHEDLLGQIAADITKMRGSFESPIMNNGFFTLDGLLPVASSMDYSVKLSSRSGGKARISTHFAGYQLCADEQGVIRPYKGISPLDTAKWILKARGAIQ